LLKCKGVKFGDIKEIKMYEISINKPNKKVKIHNIGCPHIKKTCSYQQGTSNQEYTSDNDNSFETLKDACNYIKKYFSNYKEIGCCKHCIKNEICPC
jgi:hypothetical protein